MLSKIEDLRKKPKHIRNRYAFWIALLITLFILLLWSLTLPARFAPEEMRPAPVAADGPSLSELFSSLTAQTMQRLQSLKAPAAQEAPQQPQRIDFEALIASSTALRATTSASSTATSTVATSTATTTPVRE